MNPIEANCDALSMNPSGPPGGWASDAVTDLVHEMLPGTARAPTC